MKLEKSSIFKINYNKTNRDHFYRKEKKTWRANLKIWRVRHEFLGGKGKEEKKNEKVFDVKPRSIDHIRRLVRNK